MAKPASWQPAPEGLRRRGPKPNLRAVEIPPWTGWEVRSEAAQAIRWIEEYLTVPTGHGAGAPMALAPFQRKIIRTLYDGICTFVSIPAGNGKTTLLAALAIARLVRGDAYVEVDVLATGEATAGILVNQAVRMVETCPAIADHFAFHSKPGILEYRPTGSRMQAHPARLSSVQGLAPNLAILDEAGFMADEIAESIIARAVKNPGTRIVGIGTPGLEQGNLLWRLQRDAEDGALPAGVRYLEWSSPAEYELHDRRGWRRANPAIGAGFYNIGALEVSANLMPEATFATYHLGRWVDDSGSWLSRATWEANPTIDPPPDGAEVVLGVWGTYRRTLAIVGAALDGSVFLVYAAEAATDAEVRRTLELAADRWEVLEVVHARRIRASLFAELGRADSMPIAPWPSDADTEGASANELYRALTDTRVPHDHNALLADHVQALRVRHAVDGSLRLLPPDSGTPADAALAMRAAWWRAFCIAGDLPGEPMAIY